MSPQDVGGVIACPHCGAQAPAHAGYCPACGKAVAAGTGPRVVSERGGQVASTRLGRTVQSHALTKKMKSAATALLVVAILHVLGIVLVWMQVKGLLDDPDVGGEAKLILGAQIGVTLIYFGLWAWARRSPLPAAISGLVVFLTVVFLNALVDPKSIAQGLIVKIIVIVVLVQAIQAGVAYQRLKREEAVA